MEARVSMRTNVRRHTWWRLLFEGRANAEEASGGGSGSKGWPM